jgi:hypothetical protein
VLLIGDVEQSKQAFLESKPRDAEMIGAEVGQLLLHPASKPDKILAQRSALCALMQELAKYADGDDFLRKLSIPPGERGRALLAYGFARYMTAAWTHITPGSGFDAQVKAVAKALKNDSLLKYAGQLDTVAGRYGCLFELIKGARTTTEDGKDAIDLREGWDLVGAVRVSAVTAGFLPLELTLASPDAEQWAALRKAMSDCGISGFASVSKEAGKPGSGLGSESRE